MSRLPGQLRALAGSRLFWLSLVLHGVVGWRLAPDLPGWAAAALLAWLLVSALLLPLALFHSHEDGSRAERLVGIAGLVGMGAFSSLFVLTLLREALLLGPAVWDTLVAPLGWRAALREASAAAVPLLALLATAVGAWQARRTPRVVDVSVPLPGLPAALHGFTLVQISDLHVGPTIRADYVQRVVERVNALAADVVVLTGDLVDGRVEQLADHVAPLAALAGRDGVFAVTGNHEYYAGATPWIAQLERLGMTVLINRHVAIERGGQALVLAGVPDATAHRFVPAHRSDPRQALDGAPAAARVRILLAHQPLAAEAAAAAGFDLQLSGHTHGGQFWPWRHFVPLQQPYVAGLHRHGRLWVYVSRGTGYWGPPKRLLAPSEITRIRLVPADTAG